MAGSGGPLRFVLGRLAGTAVTLFGVAVVVFVVLRALPGDTITAKLGTEAAALDPDQRAALTRYYGLDKGPVEQFLGWLGGVCQGRLGVSLDTGVPVRTLIADALPVTVELALLAMLIATPVGVALGILAASRPGRARDLTTQTLGLFGLALPEFVLASVCVAVLATVFSYFPDPGTYTPLTESVGGNLSQLIYPALVLAVGLAATIMRTTRTAYLENARSEFVRTARGKGVSPLRVRLGHILRASLVPILTMTGIQFGYLLGGTVIVEQVFALPGLGRLLLQGITQQDYAVVQSTTLLVATAFVLVNLAVDLLYRLLDPRTR
ncbi:Glutathione transport system permease protein GsiC [Streptomyces sp. RB5]|uniref:Glutathione transport system permease protein GsiC n=1 Tax=Streptomyces smaragdinus TaxID=2585196 RepID=A0A7K0CSK4_9ACTN|nr:ABC transporter permease [Streptomyces smaragdinus]MQY16449.1 Glutathione transport system permease protein GsiC [Streptomyces smaragdinus]